MRKKTFDRKVFLVGLDGATFDLITPWVNEGLLPNFARIMRGGSYGELQSIIPPLTTPAWASFITGKNPGKHGIFDFAERIDGSYDIRWVTSQSRRGRSLWKIISSHEGKVGVINIPNNYPLEKVNGFVIAWMDAPDSKNFTYPPQLAKEIKDKIGEYIITILDWKENEDLSRFQENLHRMIENRTQTTLYLMENKPWDFFAVLFSATDIVQHIFWSFMDSNHLGYDANGASKFGNTIRDVYSHIDSVLGEIINRLDEATTLILMSDHGAGGLRYVVHLNKWLEEEGLLKFHGDSEKIYRKTFSLLQSLSTNTARKALSLLKQYLPQDMRSHLKKIFPGVRDKLEGMLFSSLFDWSRTQAYSLGSYGNIYVNLKGREPDGIVKPGKEYEELRDTISARLLELKDPVTHKPVVQKVYRKEELYNGSFISKAADLIVHWSDGYHSVQRFGSKEDSVFDPRLHLHLTNIRYSGCHRMNGIFVITGNGIKGNHEIKGARIIDLAPTILYLLGLPIPLDMDGRVLKDVFTEDYLNQYPIAYEESGYEEPSRLVSYTDEEGKRIAERLKGLGYIE